MIVFYDPIHSVHDPEREYTSDGATPYPEYADRANGIGAEMVPTTFALRDGRRPGLRQAAPWPAPTHCAARLATADRVALLDIDYHHGKGN